MNGIRGASIIPFPSRPVPSAPCPSGEANPGAEPRVQPVAAQDDATARLRAALAALERAVAGQREAVARWRGALGELGGSVRGLHTSLQGYDDRLGALRGQLDGVSAHARALEAWADSALATAARDDRQRQDDQPK